MKNYNLDPFTFGNSKAAVNLTDMLNKHDDYKLTRRASYLVCHYTGLLNSLKPLSSSARRPFIQMIRNSIKPLEEQYNCPKLIQDHLTNVLVGYCKRTMQLSKKTKKEKI